MTTKAKKYTLAWPLNGGQVENIDEMLDDLYKRVSFALASSAPHMGTFGEGDLLYFGGTGIESLTAVATGNALLSGGLLTEPSWGKIGLTTHVSGTLPVANGGTGATAFMAGSIPFSNGTILTEDNANWFFDDANNTLGVGTTRSGAISATNPRLLVKGSGATSGTSSLEIQNSSGARSLRVLDDGTFEIGVAATTWPFQVSAVTSHVAFGVNHFGIDATAALKVSEPAWIGGTNKLVFGSVVTAALSGNIYQSIHGAANGEILTFRTYADYVFQSLTPGSGGAGTQVFVLKQNGNVLLGTAAAPGTGDHALVFPDGTAPASMGTNTAGLYANDVGGTVNMYAINEAGESTRLSWPAPQTYTVVNGTTDRSYDADAYTGDEIADVLATLILDLQNRGILA